MSVERPILFSGPMVRAILAGQKTQTRRIVNMRGVDYVGPAGGEDDPNNWGWADQYGDWHVIGRGYPLPGRINQGDTWSMPCPLGEPGDRLWVKETWRTLAAFDRMPPRLIPPGTPIHYEADGPQPEGFGRARPSIFMRRWMSRIARDVTAVRVERLQGISDEDARAEGIDDIGEGAGLAKIRFQNLWNAINGKRAPWEANPWVRAISFPRLAP